MSFFEWCPDIRDLISVEDVMEELGYGPNGGLIYCMEWVKFSCVLLKVVQDGADFV